MPVVQVVVLVALFVTAWPAAVMAQTTPPPDPEVTRQRIEEAERARTREPLRPIAPEVRAPQAPASQTLAGGRRFALTAVDFNTPTLIDPAAVGERVKRYIGREVDFGDIQRMVEEVNELFVREGHVTARCILPPQRIEGGRLRLQIVEATAAAVDLSRTGDLDAGFVAGWLGVADGAIVDVPAIVRRLQRLHKGTDSRIALGFRPAPDQPLATVLVPEVTAPPRWTLRAALSNEGSDAVGDEQLVLSATGNNLLGRTDRLGLFLARSKGSVQYGLPLGTFGTRVQGSYSRGDTEVLTGAFRELALEGRSNTASLALLQPVWQSAPGGSGSWALDANVAATRIDSSNRIAGADFSESQVAQQALGLALQRLWSSGEATLGVTHTRSQVDTVGVDPRSVAVTQLAASASWAFVDSAWAHLRYSQQITGEIRLPSTLQFQAGGPGSVRGYPSPAVSGDEGAIATLELHWRALPGWDFFVFSDQARTRTRDQPDFRLESAGLGATWQAQPGISVGLTWAATQRDVLPGQDRERLLFRIAVDLDRQPWFPGAARAPKGGAP
jgi:hemolysin activation/secretion protein